MASRYYVGVKGEKREVFLSAHEPTEATHGGRFTYTIGPFRSKAGADFMAVHGRNNPHCQTVAEAERLAMKDQAATALDLTEKTKAASPWLQTWG